MIHPRTTYGALETRSGQQSADKNQAVTLLNDQRVCCARITGPLFQLTHPQCANGAPFECRYEIPWGHDMTDLDHGRRAGCVSLQILGRATALDIVRGDQPGHDVVSHHQQRANTGAHHVA